MTAPRNMSRRQFLIASGTAAAAAGLAPWGSPSGATTRYKRSSPANLSFTLWAGAAEEVAYKHLVSEFEAQNKNIKVTLDIVPYASVLEGVDARLEAGNAPDLFRVVFGSLGLYSAKGALINLSRYFDSSFIDQVQPAMWAAVSYEGHIYGIPQETDTTLLLYNKDMLASAGITSMPDTLKSALSWDEFLTVAKKLKKVLPTGTYPFMYDWAQTGSYRWLTWLFEAGGNLLESDLKTPAIDSPAGEKALNFTKSFFSEGLVPKNTSTGNTTYPDSLFPAKTVAMAFAADFLLPGDIASAAKFPFEATFQPRDVTVSSDLGGSAVVATHQSRHPEAAAEFLQFLMTRENQAYFVATAGELPTRLDLAGVNCGWQVRPALMRLFAQEATTLTSFQVNQVTIPPFGVIETTLQNQLDAAFVGGQSTSATLANISTGIKSAISSFSI